MSENEFDAKQFAIERREWVLKLLEGCIRIDEDAVIEWVNTRWPHCVGVTRDSLHRAPISNSQ